MRDNGVVYWSELMTTEVEAAKAFYGQTLGLTFEAFGDGNPGYWIALRDGRYEDAARWLAKAVALTMRRPIVAVPTTYAGSEQTTIYGLTGDRHKQTGKSLDVLPRTVIYDPELTLDIPPGVTGPSAFNALAHSVEALYAPGRNPVISAMALEAIGAIHESLPVVMASPRDVEARGRLLYGAYLSGVALGSTSAAFRCPPSSGWKSSSTAPARCMARMPSTA